MSAKKAKTEQTTATKPEETKPEAPAKPEPPKAAEASKPVEVKEVSKEPTKQQKIADGFIALLKEKRPTITNAQAKQEGSKIIITFGDGGLVEVGKGSGLSAPRVKSYPKATPEVLIFADEMLAKQIARELKKQAAAQPKPGAAEAAPARA